MKHPLEGLTVAMTGNFGAHRNHNSLKRWIQRNGGQWSGTVSDNVTHLVCSKAEYLKKAPMGTKPVWQDYNVFNSLTLPPVLWAAKLQNVAIVTYDWLEGKPFLLTQT